MSQRFVFLCLLFGAFTFGQLSTLQAQSAPQVIAVSGDTAPSGNGTLGSVAAPTINNSGEVSFNAGLANTVGGNSDDAVLLVGDASGLVAEAFRQGDAAPSGGGILASAFDDAINDNGQVAFTGSLFNTPNNTRIFQFDSSTGLTTLASEGDTAPDGNGTLAQFAFDGFDFNDAGQVAFAAELSNTAGGSADDAGIFRSDIVGGTVQIARDGSPGPGINEQFVDLQLPNTPIPPINNNGQVAFTAGVATGGNSFADFAGIFVGDGTAPAITLARTGDTVIGTNSTIAGFGGFVVNDTEIGLNDSGDVLFDAIIVDDPLTGSNAREGIFRSDGNGVTAIALQDDTIPGGGGAFDSFSDASLNESGEVVFRATLASGNSDGLFFGDENSLVTIAQTGDVVPDGSGVFTGFSFGPFEGLALNNDGEAAFSTSIALTGGGTQDGIFFFGQNGLVELVREGDALLGSSITSLGFAGSFDPSFSNRSGLNDSGQVAFNFSLADGRNGVAVITVPEPGSFVLLSLATVVLAVRRRR